MLYADTDLENKLVVTNGERQRRGAREGEGENGGAPMRFHEITYVIFLRIVKHLTEFLIQIFKVQVNK